MKKIKISELPLYSSLKGLFTIGTDENNRSVKVSLEFVEQQTTQAVTNAKEATTAANEATAAAQEATEAAQEATEEAVNATDNVLLTLGRLVPTGMTVESVTRLTVGNVKPNYIKAALSPASAMKNVIFISDNKAITVGTDGRITVVGSGKSTVHVIPTCNTALAKTLLIEVVAPALRKVNSSSLRLTQSGALRFG